MNSFLSDLKTNLLKTKEGAQKPWGGVNPLILIGLTDTILNLGLDEQQLYHVVKSYGRQLTAQVHPDRNITNVSEETRKQIFDVFNTLDNFDEFRLALNEFQSIRAEDRRENRVLLESVSSLRHQVSVLEESISQMRIARERLVAERQEFERVKQAESLELPGLKEYCRKIGKDSEELRKNNVSLRKIRMVWEQRFVSAMKYILSLSETKNTRLSVLDAQWVAVISLWHKDEYPVTPDDVTWLDKFEQIAKIRSMKIPHEEIITAWKFYSKQFRKLDPLETNQLPLSLSILSLKRGVPSILFGDHATINGGRIMGSIDPSIQQITRRHLTHTMESMDVTRLTTPYLVLGGLLVSLMEIPGKKASWSITCPAYKYYTKRIIVAVG
ncbi:MAG: hypothetical protein ACYCZW_02200 [Minisyncoccota bacterium]